MKTSMPNFLKKTVLRNFLTVLVFGFTTQPFCLFAQSNNPNLNSINCNFSNLDGINVISCGSIVKANITLSNNVPSDLTHISLTFPNSFEIINNINCTPVGSIISDIPAINNYAGTGINLQSGGLVRQVFNNFTSNSITISFAYRNCNVNNNSNINTTALFFDLDGGPQTNPLLYSATLNTVNPGLPIFNNSIAKATHINLDPISVSTITPTPYSGNLLTSSTRDFIVTINSMSIQNFQLSINNESDINSNSLSVIGSNVQTISSFNYGANSFNSFDLGNSIFTGNININGNIRTITFRQSFTIVCPPPNPLALQTSIIARLACNCTSPNPPPANFFNTPPLNLNAQVIEVPSTINVSTTFSNSNSVNSTSLCPGVFYYNFKLVISGVTNNLTQITIPLNTTSFSFLGVDQGLSPSSLSPLSIPILPANNNPNASIIIPFNLTQNSNLPGFLSTYNGIQGNWFDIPSGGPLVFYLRVRLQYSCTNTADCEFMPMNVTPILPNQNEISFITKNQCGTQLINSSPLNKISSPNIPAATVEIEGVPLSAVVGGPPVPFNCTVNIPTQSPFLINIGSNPAVNCSNITYRAVFSLLTPNSTIGNITDLLVNNVSATSTISGNQIFIDLPPISSTTQAFQSFSIKFKVANIQCNSNLGSSTFTIANYRLAIQAICNDCTTNCSKNLGCGNQEIFVHCPGSCDGFVGIDDDVTILRSTFGYHNLANFNLNSPIPNETEFNTIFAATSDDDRKIQRSRMYPFDIFTISANGSVIPLSGGLLHEDLGLELNYSNIPQLGGNFIEFVDYQATFTPTSGGPPINISLNNLPGFIQVPINFSSPILQSVTPFTQDRFVRSLGWAANDLFNSTTNNPNININAQAWNVSLVARFRVVPLPTSIPSSYPCGIQCQFISIPNIGPKLTSCDPYGANITVLVPGVQIVQNSTQTGSLNLPQTLPNNTVFTTNSNESCKFYHAIGIRHFGGFANNPDFNLEYRPLTSWPASIVSTNVSNVFGFNGSGNSFTGSPTFQNTIDNLHLLPTLQKGDVPANSFQGLVLKLDRECPNTQTIGGTPIIPIPLQINRFAYLHAGHGNINPNPNQLIAQPAIIPSSNLNCSSFMGFSGASNTAINIPDGTFNYPFTLSVPASADGLPIAFKISTTAPAIDVSLSTMNSTLSFTQNGDWYFFPNGLPLSFPGMVTNSSVGINLLGSPGCYGQEFNVTFEWQVFCTTQQYQAFFTNSTISNCMNCSTTRTFKRGNSNLTNTNISSNFTTENCNLEWNLQVINPASQPTINLSQLGLNFSSGMIFESATAEIICASGTTDLTADLTIPLFQLIQQPPSSTFVQNTLTLDSISLNPGCTLKYKLLFSLSQEFCSTFVPSNPIFNATLNGKNVCSDEFEIVPVQINTNQFANAVQLLNSQTPSCCNNPTIGLIHPCGPSSPSTGSITAFNNNPLPSDQPISASLFLTATNLLIESAPNITNPNHTFSNLVEGTYSLITFNPLNGAFISQEVLIEDYSFSATLTSNLTTVCQGAAITLTADATPLNSPANIPYIFTYNWSPTNASTTNTATFNPNVTSTYQVTVSNGSCNATATTEVIVNPIPATPVLNSNSPICQGQSLNLAANTIANATYTWQGPNGFTSNAQNPVITNATTAASGIYTLTLSVNGCSSSQSISVTVNPPLLPSVSIAASQTTICSGTSVTFTATPTNGGTTPTYDWTVNGIPTGTNAATFSSNTLTNGANVQATIISNATCASPTTATSNSINITVNNLVTPSVTIDASQTTICAGTEVIFTASPTNGGANPIYAWTLNGNPVGTNSDTFTSSNFSNNDVIELTISTNATCASPLSATSNPIAIILNTSPLCQCSCIDPVFGTIITPTTISNFEDLVILSGSQNPSLNNLCLYFQNDIIISTSLGLFDCTITTAPGKKIIVNENATFAASNTTFRGCDTMWVGIQNKGKAKFIDNIIQDAKVGFEMVRSFSSIPQTYLRGNIFKNNYVGLQNSYVAGNHQFNGPINCLFDGGGLLPGYSGQIPNPNILGGYTGILIQNRFSMNIDKSNTFQNLYNGVIVYNQSMVRIDQAKFTNISFDTTNWDDNLLYENFDHTDYNLFPNYAKSPSAAVNANLDCFVQISGSGTTETSDVMFYGCNVSVYNFKPSFHSVENVKIDGDDVQQSKIGIVLVNTINNNPNVSLIPFVISNNRIRANSIGILLHSNGSTSFIGSNGLIENNNITVLDKFDLSPPDFVDPNILKKGISIYSALNAKGIYLNNNTINLRSEHANDGIFISTSDGIGVNTNFVRRFSRSKGAGFHVLNGNLETILKCNSSIGTDNNVMDEQNQGYFIESAAPRIDGNYSHRTNAGFAFNGPCTGVDINNNQMGVHNINPSNTAQPFGSMHFGTNATFGELVDKLNMFDPSGFAFKVAFSGDDRFTYSDTWPINSPTYVPNHQPSNPDCSIEPFFRCTGTLTTYPDHACGSDTTSAGSDIPGMMIANPGGTTSVATALVTGQLNYPVYNEESKFEVAKSIDRAIKEQSIVLPNTQVYDNWKDSISVSNSSKLNSYTAQWKKDDLAPDHVQLIQDWEVASKDAFDFAMAYYESIVVPEDLETAAAMQTYTEMVDKEETAHALFQSLKIADENRTMAKKDSATYWNQGLIDPKDYEAMERTINEIYLNTIAIGEFQFSPAQMSQISQIAFQCPLKSASAVFKAREMYAIDHPLANFDNYQLCANQGIQYRIGNTENTNTINITQLANQLQIEEKGANDLQNYRLFNSLGQILLEWKSSLKLQTIDIGTLNLSTGIYIIQAQKASGIQSNKKFIYTK